MAAYRPVLPHASTSVPCSSCSNNSRTSHRPTFERSPLSAPSSISVESITKDKNKNESLLGSSSLPNRPANNLQQQYSHSKAKANSNRSRVGIEEDKHEQNYPPANAGYASSVLYYNSPLLKQHQQQHEQKKEDPVVSAIASSSSPSLSSSQSATTYTPQRPILTSKFSFDNLTLAGDTTAADSNTSSSINVGAALAPIKKMVTKTWLQNITNVARNSTTISGSSVSSPPAQTSSSSVSGNNANHQIHHQQQASISSTCSATSSSTGRQEQHQIPPSSSSSSSSSALQRFRKKSTSPIRASFSSSPPSTSTSHNAMVISNPELVHANGNLPNMTLGAGAKRIGRQAEIFGNTPNHYMYTAPSSPPPRTSEDSVRSLVSSTSSTSSHTNASYTSAGSMASSSATAVSYSSSSAIPGAPSCSSSSFGRSRQERDLPYLPLRVRTVATQKGVTSSSCSSSSLNGGDAVEQLASTPHLPDSAKYILRAVQLAEENEQREEEEAKGVPTTAPNSLSISTSALKSGSTTREEEIPFGHSASSRPSSLSSPTRGKDDEKQLPNSSLSPGRSSFHHSNRRECLPDNLALRSIMSNEAAARSMPNLASPTSSTKTTAKPSSSSPKSKEKDVNALSSSKVTMASSSKPFSAILLSSPSPSSQELSDAQRLVTVYPGGNRAFTTTLQSLRSHPDSHLARFIEESLLRGQQDAVITSPVQPLQSASMTPIPSASSKEAHMSDTYIKPTQVTLHLPNSPIGALRSARASIYDDVPSDEGEQDDSEYAFFSETKPFASDRLEVPLPHFPNPRQTRLRFSRIPSSGQVSSASEYTNSEADQDALNSFIDTTPDDEMNDPFHFQRDESPMSAMHEDGKSAPTSTHHNRVSSEETAKENTSPVLSHYSSHPPSLSSSPNSSAFQGGSPIRFSTVAGKLDTKSPFESLLASQESGLQKHISIYLDRSPESYESIFHYLRAGNLPRRLCMNLHNGEMVLPSQGDNVMLLQCIEALSNEGRREILPLLLQPVLAELSDLREEAQYLGCTSLVDLCSKELEKLHTALAPQRKTAAHPVKTTSKTSVADLSVARSRVASPVRPPGGHRLNANGLRPRFTGHRANASESMVQLKLTPRTRAATQDNWI